MVEPWSRVSCKGVELCISSAGEWLEHACLFPHCHSWGVAVPLQLRAAFRYMDSHTMDCESVPSSAADNDLPSLALVRSLTVVAAETGYLLLQNVFMRSTMFRRQQCVL